ncbi:unnamed protein product [Angiostrongylus costaricensis]|uniref:PMD domain-containing protein n=1 Tax=Angiostrongylus costaricensis TaxID=334426 RepID=A0A0R3PTV1_ANGCS|nr:unnamed protein product [Angiostrongylus costaricensis]
MVNYPFLGDYAVRIHQNLECIAPFFSGKVKCSSLEQFHGSSIYLTAFEFWSSIRVTSSFSMEAMNAPRLIECTASLKNATGVTIPRDYGSVFRFFNSLFHLGMPPILFGPQYEIGTEASFQEALAVIPFQILCMHGGLSPSVIRMPTYQKVFRYFVRKESTSLQ